MSKPSNKTIAISALKRFLRVIGAMALSYLIPSLIELLSSLQMSDDIAALITTICIPLLVSFDKVLRSKGLY